MKVTPGKIAWIVIISGLLFTNSYINLRAVAWYSAYASGTEEAKEVEGRARVEEWEAESGKGPSGAGWENFDRSRRVTVEVPWAVVRAREFEEARTKEQMVPGSTILVELKWGYFARELAVIVFVVAATVMGVSAAIGWAWRITKQARS